MRPENYNPKARQKFGETLVDIGVSIYKGIMLLFTVALLTFILSNASDKGKVETSITDLLAFMSSSSYLLFLSILVIAFFAGHYFRKEGLRHIHESEGNQSC